MKSNLSIIYRTLIVAIITVFAITSCSRFGKPDNAFTIDGSLRNVKAKYFLLATETSNDSLVVDTIRVNGNGSFSYEGKIDSISIAYLYLEENGVPVNIFINKGWNVKISGDAEVLDLIEIKGGSLNDDLTEFKKENKKLLESRARLRTQQKNDTLKVNPTYETDMKNVEFEIASKAREYVKANPDKIASVILTYRYFKKNTNIEALDELVATLRGDAASFFLTKELKEYSAKIKKSQVGMEAPSFTLPNSANRSINISNFRGKYVLLSFMSATCPFCEAEIPYMKEAYKTLQSKNENIVFVPVYIDSDQKDLDSVKTEISTFPKDWVILIDKKGWAAESVGLYNITQIPYNILISPEGKILERDLTIASLPDKLAELKAEKK